MPGVNSYRCSGYRIVQTPPSITYSLRLLELSEPDRQQMQSDVQHIPRPQLRHHSYEFTIPANSEIRFVKLLTKKKCLLILDDGKQNLDIYLELLENLSNAVQNIPSRSKKHLYKEKLGQITEIAYDETKRTLVVCTLDVYKVS